MILITAGAALGLKGVEETRAAAPVSAATATAPSKAQAYTSPALGPDPADVAPGRPPAQAAAAGPAPATNTNLASATNAPAAGTPTASATSTNAPASAAATAPATPMPAPDEIEPPLVNYPVMVPLSTLADHDLTSLLHLKAARDLTRIPVPNPWFPIDLYQQTMTRKDFEAKLKTLYDPFGVFPGYYTIDDQRVTIYPATGDRRAPQFTLEFAPPGQAPRPRPRWFRTPDEFRAEAHPLDKPLAGLRVAIDPGHIGGVWAQMEERSTRYHGSAPVQEGDLNLITGRILNKELTALGASVYVVRDSTDPVTPYRPEDMLPEASELLRQQAAKSPRLHALPPDKLNLLFGHRLTELSQFLFYRCSEIIERGNRIRNNFVPDITVTLYIDATPESGRGRLTSGNANIFFVHGSYTRSEMADPEMQRRCIYKMVEGGAETEAKVAAAIAAAFSERTKLGPVKYGNSATTRQVLPDNQYVVARNLAANREYDGPVVCTEPYFMNNRVVYQRLLAGDYDGVKTFNGKPYTSIFREYADCVAAGLVKAYANNGIAGTGNVAPATVPVK